MAICAETVEKNLEELTRNINDLKQQFEQICEEWNDIELAISDLNHFQEFLEFHAKGAVWLQRERRRLFEERRVYKTMYQRIAPHIKHIGSLHITLAESPPPYEPTLYGIRSIRGYNLFHELPKHVKAHNQKFADMTGSDTVVSRIYKPILHDQVFKRAKLEVGKIKTDSTDLLVPPTLAITEHGSYANHEQREEWAKYSGGSSETVAERNLRIEHELETTLRMGTNKQRRIGGY